jgi:hypothetical protein
MKRNSDIDINPHLTLCKLYRLEKASARDPPSKLMSLFIVLLRKTEAANGLILQ